MKKLYSNVLLAISMVAAAGTTFGQVPSTNDTSDPTLHNTGGGTGALSSASSGGNNTAYGDAALASNTEGEYNTAVGANALMTNTNGLQNSAFGENALISNTYGDYNTASGFSALAGNTHGNYNTAVGTEALAGNVVGLDNTAIGFQALKVSTANENTALGMNALFYNRAGGGNTASGFGALASNTNGHYNIANGYRAGYNLTTGNYNIDVGNVGVAAESGAIRIGTSGQQTQTFIAGITNNSSVSGPYVVIDSTTGQLGVSTTPPSAPVKTAYVPQLLKQMGQQASEIRTLKQQVEELKAFSEKTQIALQKLQAKDELMARR
jgi:hypothetical protein